MAMGADRLLLLLPLALLPVTNVIVRYRLAYYPRRQESQETSDIPEENEQPPGLIGVTKRVYGEEGLGGFYRGLLPVLILTLIGLPHLTRPTLSPWHWLLYKPIITPGPFIYIPQGIFTLFPTLSKNAFMMLALAWIYRCISTPTKLSITHHTLSAAVQNLFSPFELSTIFLAPFKTLLTPGLACAVFLSIVLRLIHLVIMVPPTWMDWKDPYKLGLLLKVTLPSLLVMLFLLPPIDVVTTRLLTQKSKGHFPYWTVLGLEAKIFTVIIGLLNLFALPIVLDPSPKNYIGGLVEFLLCIIDAIFWFYLSVAWTLRWRRSSQAREAQVVLTEQSPLLGEGPVNNAEGDERTTTSIQIRRDSQQYASFYDCLSMIVKEEGFFTLYRCWWLTMLELIVASVIL